MESALYDIYALVVFISENSLVRYVHSFVFWYINNSCVNTVLAHFPWSNLYIDLAKPKSGAPDGNNWRLDQKLKKWSIVSI